MGASTGVRSPAQRTPSARRALESLRAELDDPKITALVIGALVLFTFSIVRLAGGAPSALMELGYVPVALAAYAYGRRGGLAVGIATAAVLGPAPALLGFDRVEGPFEWLLRVAAFGGIGAIVGHLLERPGSQAGRAGVQLGEAAGRERDGIVALAMAAESRDTEAGEHVRRLEITSRRLAARAGLGNAVAAEVGWAAMLHDLGKMRVPERILLKPEPLDPDEWTIVRLHPIWSEQALAGGKHLALAREIARSHHENWDGTGYPDGLYGDRIPLAARIVRIADAFDAMTNRRPYQQPVSFEAALEELQANAGHDFDPELVRHFTDLLRTDADLRNELTGLRQI
jgi:HD-GYP domain-containing protein (c-di-GMP phosphodiesterase class II)